MTTWYLGGGRKQLVGMELRFFRIERDDENERMYGLYMRDVKR